MADRVRLQVSLVLLLIDDFTGRVLTGSGSRAWIEGRRPPIRKAEGYFVFSGLPAEPVEVKIESGMYEPLCLTVDLARERREGGFLLRRVRLTPGRAYRLPPGTTCIEGMAEPGSRLRLFCRGGAGAIKLLYDCGGAREDGISLYCPGGEDVSGRLLWIENRKKEGEFFTAGDAGGREGDYRLTAPLSRAYKKIGTTVYPVYTALADGRGGFYLPLPGLKAQSLPFCCEAEGESGLIRCERELSGGELNRLDLRPGHC